jgi:hypothetical protein
MMAMLRSDNGMAGRLSGNGAKKLFIITVYESPRQIRRAPGVGRVEAAVSVLPLGARRLYVERKML